MSARLNPPPNWPEPPQEGWVPPPNWVPRAEWGAVPAGWRLWVDSATTPNPGATPLQPSEDVPASGARPRPRVEQYPVNVVNPGMYSDNHLEEDDYGFEPGKARRNRPGWRLGLTITGAVLGLALAVATVFFFAWVRDFARTVPEKITSAATAIELSDAHAAPTALTAPRGEAISAECMLIG